MAHPPRKAVALPAGHPAHHDGATRAHTGGPRRPLAGAILAEQHDEWTEGRRYLGLDNLARSRITAAPASAGPAAEVTPDSDLQALSA